MNSDTWYLIFAGIAAIGALRLVSGKTLDKAEKTGVWIIFGGFVAQSIWYVTTHWPVSFIVYLIALVYIVLIGITIWVIATGR